MTDYTLEQRLAKWREASKKAAKANAIRTRLENWRKVVLAQQMRKAEARGVTSVAAQEREARASEEYQQSLYAIEQAQEEADILTDEKIMLGVWARAWQTERADQRKEREAYQA